MSSIFPLYLHFEVIMALTSPVNGHPNQILGDICHIGNDLQHGQIKYYRKPLQGIIHWKSGVKNPNLDRCNPIFWLLAKK
jgi:hypothetical protein